ncbi:MAG: prolyl oligopeptidase family serine peptidase [Opitutaceae bacterium]|nr:prolyl oligopeptidase family serine peptidase [Opitutaceae bacterium]
MIAGFFRHHARRTCLAAALATVIPMIHGADTPPPAPLPVVPPQLDYIDLFTPLRTEMATLSPDGRRVAYTFRQDGALAVVVVDAARPSVPKRSVTLLTDREATSSLDPTATRGTSARAHWMGWSADEFLVIETNRIFQAQVTGAASSNVTTRSSWAGTPGSIVAYEPESGRARTLVTPDTVAVTRTRAATIPRRRGRTIDASQSASVTSHTHDVGYDGPAAVDGGGAPSAPDLILPGIPSVQGFAPGANNTLIVRAESVDGLETFRLDVRSGKLQPTASFRPGTASAVLLDAAGHPRIQIPIAAKPNDALEFTIADATARAKWGPLAVRVPASVAAGFSISAETFLGHRAVPLAFDTTGRTLLFASNLGRETFGIYGIDLGTGVATDLVIEHPTLDLYQPRRGLFPDPALAVRADFRISADASTDSDLWSPEGDILTSTSPEQANEDSQWTQAYRRFLAQAALARARRPASDPSPLVFDRFTGELIGVRVEGMRLSTSWFRPEFAQAQASLEREFPDRNIEIREWDAKYEIFLVLSHGPSWPGAYNLYHRTENRMVEFAPRSARTTAASANRTVPFAFAGPGGARLTGTLTFPRAVRDAVASRVPVVVLCPTEPWRPFRPEYSPEVQALARMGLAVVRVNTRGMWGSGVSHRSGLESGFDRVQAEDLVATLDHLGVRYPINLRRVAVLGEGLGGHLALRSVQQFPDRFRCAVAIEAPINLKTWMTRNRWARSSEARLLRGFFGNEAALEAAPLLQPEGLPRPVCIFTFPGDEMVPAGPEHLEGRALVSRTTQAGVAAEFISLTAGYLSQEPQARAEVFRHIEAFFNTTVYDYLVGIGETEVVPDP